MKMKVKIDEKTEAIQNENIIIEAKQKELNIKLGDISKSLEQAEKDLNNAKDVLTKEIKSYVAEVKSFKVVKPDFMEVIKIFSMLLFKKNYKSDEEAKQSFISESGKLNT